MKKAKLYKLFMPGNKLLYKSYNSYDHSYIEIAYKVIQRTTTKTEDKVELEMLILKTDIPGADLMNKPGVKRWFFLEDLVTLTHEWSLLPDNYELIYVRRS